MTKYFHAITGTIYDTSIHPQDQIPSDVVIYDEEEPKAPAIIEPVIVDETPEEVVEIKSTKKKKDF